MSTQKFIKSELDMILLRLKQAAGVSKEGDLAKVLGISRSNYSNRKKRNTLQPLIVNWAVENDIDLNWLLYGSGDTITTSQPEPDTSDIPTEQNQDIRKEVENRNHLLELIKAQKITIETLKDRVDDLKKQLDETQAAKEDVGGLAKRQRRR